MKRFKGFMRFSNVKSQKKTLDIGYLFLKMDVDKKGIDNTTTDRFIFVIYLKRHFSN